MKEIFKYNISDKLHLEFKNSNIKKTKLSHQILENGLKIYFLKYHIQMAKTYICRCSLLIREMPKQQWDIPHIDENSLYKKFRNTKFCQKCGTEEILGRIVLYMVLLLPLWKTIWRPQKYKKRTFATSNCHTSLHLPRKQKRFFGRQLKWVLCIQSMQSMHNTGGLPLALQGHMRNTNKAQINPQTPKISFCICKQKYAYMHNPMFISAWISSDDSL